jgi:hypothetical protein
MLLTTVYCLHTIPCASCNLAQASLYSLRLRRFTNENSDDLSNQSLRGGYRHKVEVRWERQGAKSG